MKIAMTTGIRRAAAALALLAYSAALAWGSLTPITRKSLLAGGSVRQAVDNFLHAPAYAGLACLWAVALGFWRPPAAFRRDYGLGAAAALLFGGAMELLQIPVHGRYCSFSDFLLDMLGVALAAPVIWVWCRRTAGKTVQPAA